MAEYIQNKTEVVNSGEKIIFNNQCKNPVEVGTGLIFQEDGTYIVSVYNGKITVYESGGAFEKSDEIPPQIVEAGRRNEEKIKAKVEELNEEFIAQKRFQIEQLKAEIEELKLRRKSLNYKECFENPPIYPAYTGFNKCGEEEETEPYKLYINACDPVNKVFIGYRCNKCDADINLFFDHYCPNCGRKINWEAIKNENSKI